MNVIVVKIKLVVAFYGTTYMSCNIHRAGESSIFQMHCADAGTSIEVETDADSINIIGHAHDDKPRPYLCTVCHKRFTKKRNLNVHKRIHSGEKPFVCTVCNKRFTRRYFLNMHSKRHTGENLYL